MASDSSNTAQPSTRARAAEDYRPRLFGIAYRMLGNIHDAEDAVQEGMLRWQEAAPNSVREPEAWLVAVVTRIAIDRLRIAARDRAVYPGPWLPEPVADERVAPDKGVELASDLSMAFLVLLERLAPEERAAFLLRDVFDSDYAEIADVLGKSEAAARQVVHRARVRVRASRPRFDAPPEAKERLFHQFIAALEADDKEGLLAVLASDATFTSDGGGKISAARRTVHGNEKIARMLLILESKFDHPFTYSFQHLNGELALAMHRGSELFAVTFCETDGERIVALYRVMNPDKLLHLS